MEILNSFKMYTHPTNGFNGNTINILRWKWTYKKQKRKETVLGHPSSTMTSPIYKMTFLK